MGPLQTALRLGQLTAQKDDKTKSLVQNYAVSQLSYKRYCVFVFWFDSPPVGQGLLIHEVSRSHTTTHHSWYDSSGRVISSSQRPLPDNTQHSQKTNIHSLVGFEPTTPAGERPQTYALDSEGTGAGIIKDLVSHPFRILASTQIILAVYRDFLHRTAASCNQTRLQLMTFRFWYGLIYLT